MPQERSILKMIWTNFINSLRPRQYKGNLIGKDHLGNRYFEIPPDRSVGRRKSSRWFEPSVKDRFDAELPSEWEAWLRGRRTEPPVEEEVLKNVAIAKMKKENAAELAKQFPSAPPQPTSEQKVEFPTYKDYEIMPGTHQDKLDKDK